MGAHGGSSLKLLTAFVAFMAGRELFQLFAESSEWLANMVGLGVWSIVMYVDPPRSSLSRLMFATASLILLVAVLHFLHIG